MTFNRPSSERSVSVFIWLWLLLNAAGSIAFYWIEFTYQGTTGNAVPPSAEFLAVALWLAGIMLGSLSFFSFLHRIKLGLGLLVLSLILPVWFLIDRLFA
jgi:hypothetical protein